MGQRGNTSPSYMSQFVTYRGTAGRARVAVDSSGRAGEQAQEVLPLRKPQMPHLPG
jgi:hypothetical protein